MTSANMDVTLTFTHYSVADLISYRPINPRGVGFKESIEHTNTGFPMQGSFSPWLDTLMNGLENTRQKINSHFGKRTRGSAKMYLPIYPIRWTTKLQQSNCKKYTIHNIIQQTRSQILHCDSRALRGCSVADVDEYLTREPTAPWCSFYCIIWCDEETYKPFRFLLLISLTTRCVNGTSLHKK